MRLSLITSFLCCCFFLGCNNQAPEKPDTIRRKSPIAIAAVNHGDTYVKIVYGQPYKRGRSIFGGLVPFNEVWRTGANEATEMTTTKPILFNGERLAAGTYALFTIPHKENWTIILNSVLGQWGDFEYNKYYDVLRTTVPSTEAEQPAEAFTIQIGKVREQTASIFLHWDTTKVQIPITFLSSQSDSLLNKNTSYLHAPEARKNDVHRF